MRKQENTESHADVSLGLATTEQIFSELAERFETVLLVTDGASCGQNDGILGTCEYRPKGNPFTLIGLSEWAGREILRDMMERQDGSDR